MNYSGSNSKQQLVPGLSNIICSSIFAYFFYKYGWNNPDLAITGTCWATDANEVGSSIDLGSGYKNVSDEFISWFQWGFIINMCTIVIGCLQLVHFATESIIIGRGWQAIGCPIGCGWIAWFITAMVLRWRHIGKVCSGDYYSGPGILYPPDIYMH